jgi:hypothetical protein
VKAFRPTIRLKLKGNQGIVFPPRHIAEDQDKLTEFLLELQHSDSLPLSSLNVLLVGNGAAGKTTLKMKALLGKRPFPTGVSVFCCCCRCFCFLCVYHCVRDLC